MAVIAATASGCSSFKHRNQLADFNSAYQQGDYLAAAESMTPSAPIVGEESSENQTLELLHQAEAYRLSGDYDNAVAAYDQVEEGMKLLDTAGMVEKGMENGLAVLVNDSELDYEPMMSEAVLVNTYKALSFLYLGEGQNARIEFNRANDRTRRAVSFFGDEIAEQRKALEDGEAQETQAVNASLDSDGLTRAVEQHYGQTSVWSTYPEFIVPSATYLHGLYFLASGESGDLARAATSLGRVADMAPDNPTLAQDASLADDLASGVKRKSDLEPLVWVVYENGLGPVVEETRFDVPLLLFHGNTQAPAYTGIALPRYADRQAVGDDLSILLDGGEAHHPDAFSDMGKVVRTEMQTRFPAVLSRAVASAVVKAFLQNEASEQMGALGQLGSAWLTAATTQADLRSWQATPDHWEVARFDRPASGQLSLATSEGTLGELELPDWPFTLIYVKRPTALSPAEVSLVDLQGQEPGIHSSLGSRAPAKPAADSSDDASRDNLFTAGLDGLL
ncbi:hypothetical protein [Halomonas sp. YLGW01]|uniref:COG3014 family protein n=1 Tax=Halomonas sp. YLGW01 TaxID=2773308 RepID=UPI00178401FB|nr:hypothetical protein [Halomonas sp. YLGW01]